jgi:hypothetical protein
MSQKRKSAADIAIADRGYSGLGPPAVPTATPQPQPPPPAPPPLPTIQPPPVTGIGSGGIISAIDAKIEPVRELNYSLLHNNRPLFQEFTIHKAVSDFGRVRITVDLFQGELSMPFKEIVELKAGVDALHLHRDPRVDTGVKPDEPIIRLPLASRLLRSLREPVRSTMLVQITTATPEAKLLYERTFFVTLLPVDQWRDTAEDRQWLPSFLQPRDPAIDKIVQLGEKYLRALCDDMSAGFNGYQSIIPGPSDPFADPTQPTLTGDQSDEERYAGVDLQVRAIWAALLDQHRLSYINPPPEYRRDSQRLRRPYEVIEGSHGTCIELAILIASCLEYIDIYPVIFLLKDHAFPGYWRSEAFQDKCIKDSIIQRNRSDTLTENWYFAKEPCFPSIRSAVAEGWLVPLETVRLTDQSSFRTALDEGLENLRTPFEFDAMIDIQTARKNNITPIPLVGGQ